MTTTLSPQEVADRIRASRCTVAMTGAGVSTAAGIPDFRGPGGLYESRTYDPMKVFDIGHFHHDPTDFWAFTRDLARTLDDLAPTRTHRFLAELEQHGLLEGVVTQNIDPFHSLAGSQNVLALHGSYATTRCLSCGQTFDYEQMKAKVLAEAIPACTCSGGGRLKPDVVFFGEAVKHLDESFALVSRSELLLVLGSSLVVQPAALLPEVAGGAVVVVNRGPCGLRGAPGRYFIDADLDEFFDAVADALGRED